MFHHLAELAKEQLAKPTKNAVFAESWHWKGAAFQDVGAFPVPAEKHEARAASVLGGTGSSSGLVRKCHLSSCWSATSPSPPAQTPGRIQKLKLLLLFLTSLFCVSNDFTPANMTKAPLSFMGLAYATPKYKLKCEMVEDASSSVPGAPIPKWQQCFQSAHVPQLYQEGDGGQPLPGLWDSFWQGELLC